ncbi:ATP-binding protein [Roseobacter sp.]|uniref:sensor histidine kinase n=1 Tax=Roseobacter sp. TaxID=1907202 RepID=UPI003858C9AF
MTRTAQMHETDTALPTGSISADSKEIEDFIYLISHDFRTSVRALIELPQWIEEDLAEAGVKIDGSVAESIELMNRHTGRLDRMLVDLLTFSRVGRMQTMEQIDLNAVLDEVLEEMRIPPGFKVVRALECADLKMGEIDVLTLLTALISNAVKHHDRSSGQIVVTCRSDGTHSVLSVQDNGPGIATDHHDRVFGAMTTLKPRDEVEGSGMGLAIVKKIAKLYNGDAQVIENAGSRGTTVEVRLQA